ncbi:MAG: L-aspartate oxidase [Bacillota bacterium]
MSADIRTCDYLIIGTGIAGLYTALKAAPHGRVVVLTKKRTEDSATEYAQGGIASAIGQADSPALHMADTLAAGAGLCDIEAVQVLVDEGPECVMELVAMGTQFDRTGEDFALTREGAHSQRRILHARGDATGEEIRQALSAQVADEPRITVREDWLAVQLLVGADGACVGVLALSPEGEPVAHLARATVIATGGAGQIFGNTTNPAVATGDGIAMAYLAGAAIADPEFFQFHPTALYHQGSPKFLISEAVRGEGALLLTAQGRRFMDKYHPKAELAARDVVARAIWEEMQAQGSECVYLDARPLGERIRRRFPRIYETCLGFGLDMLTEPVPVAPAAHYFMGGIRTDTWGRTSLSRLYACGEAACVGVHGANRLAANSLLEGLVFGKRIASAMAQEPALPETTDWQPQAPVRSYPADMRGRLQQLMWKHAGIVRDGPGLLAARSELEGMLAALEPGAASPGGIELGSMLTVGWLVCRGAELRTESRGGHYRRDYPARDEAWARHTILTRQGPEPAAR